jgi:hypothetical protein
MGDQGTQRRREEPHSDERSFPQERGRGPSIAGRSNLKYGLILVKVVT